MIYLKSTGSEVFDEAYFVVRDDAMAMMGECDMIKEANRILNECISQDEKFDKGQIVLDFIKRKTVPFLIGMIIGIIIAILIK